MLVLQYRHSWLNGKLSVEMRTGNVYDVRTQDGAGISVTKHHNVNDEKWRWREKLHWPTANIGWTATIIYPTNPQPDEITNFSVLFSPHRNWQSVTFSRDEPRKEKLPWPGFELIVNERTGLWHIDTQKGIPSTISMVFYEVQSSLSSWQLAVYSSHCIDIAMTIGV